MDADHTLGGIELFADLSVDDRSAVERLCRWRRYAAGDTIHEAGSSDRSVFFMIKGAARAVNYSFSGREVTLDEFTPGASFGEIGALDVEPRPGAVVARISSLVASLSAERFRELLRQHPSVCWRLLTRLGATVRAADTRVTDLATLGAIDRVHAELLRLSGRVGEDEDDGRPVAIRPAPPLSDIAFRAGTARETVSRVLSELTQRGVLARQDDALVITDLEGLRGSFAEETVGERRSGRDRRQGLDRRQRVAPPPGPDRRSGVDRRALTEGSDTAEQAGSGDGGG